MAQRPKEEMRLAIVRAAADAFAEVGFERAALAAIAAEAGTSIGNLYKYFSSKEELFAAAVPEDVADELAARLTRRVEALGDARDVHALAEGHAYAAASEDLLAFSIANRAPILFLLRHGRGTAHASFADDLARRLTKLATAYASRAHGEDPMTAPRRRALERFYRGFVASLASILAEETTARAIRAATTHLTTYHLAGLRSFFESRASTEDS